MSLERMSEQVVTWNSLIGKMYTDAFSLSKMADALVDFQLNTITPLKSWLYFKK